MAGCVRSECDRAALSVNVPDEDQPRIASLEERIARLEEENRAMAATIALLEENQEILFQLITANKSKSTHNSSLLDELYKQMIAIGRKQTDFATAARMLGKSKARLLQLKTDIAFDDRFSLVPSESHSQKLLIRLRNR